jgi:hypothetical protein
MAGAETVGNVGPNVGPAGLVVAKTQQSLGETADDWCLVVGLDPSYGARRRLYDKQLFTVWAK